MRKMKKMFCAVLLFFACLFGMMPAMNFCAKGIAASAAGFLTLSLDVPETAVGEEFDVKISIRENPGIIVLFLNVTYEKNNVTLLSVEDKKLLNGWYEGNKSSGEVVLAWDDSLASKNNAATGEIATLRFQAIREGSAEIEVRAGRGGCVDYDLNELTVAPVYESITISAEQQAPIDPPDDPVDPPDDPIDPPDCPDDPVDPPDDPIDPPDDPIDPPDDPIDPPDDPIDPPDDPVDPNDEPIRGGLKIYMVWIIVAVSVFIIGFIVGVVLIRKRR